MYINFQSEDESEGWRGEGIHLEPVEPLKQWAVRFQARKFAVFTYFARVV
jgi:hypothetical protein